MFLECLLIASMLPDSGNNGKFLLLNLQLCFSVVLFCLTTYLVYPNKSREESKYLKFNRS